MASKKDDRAKQTKRANSIINRLANTLQVNMDNLYQKTYYTQASNKHDIESIKSKLDASIDSIVTLNKTQTGQGNISTLYSRIQNDRNEQNSEVTKYAKDLETVLNDNTLLDSGVIGFINDTTTLADYDSKIDTILKYMPKLKEALDCKKDNVLSADHFSKDFINVKNENVQNDQKSVNEHIKELKDRYDLLNFFDELYDETSKRGEAFVYEVPAKKAIAKLLSNKNKLKSVCDINMTEGCLLESTGEKISFDMTDINDISFDEIKEQIDNVSIEYTNGLLENVVQSEYNYYQTKEEITKLSITEGVIEEARSSDDEYMRKPPKILIFSDKTKAEAKKLGFKKEFDKTIDELKLSNYDDTSSDGLITSEKMKNNKKEIIEVPGTILKIIDHKKVIPLYIEEHCIGYYYIETNEMNRKLTNFDRMQDPTFSLSGSSSMLSTSSMADQTSKQNNIIRFLANQMSMYINANFVNTNQDLRDEIYMVLKQNDMCNRNNFSKIRITFIPPEDMEHVYFRMDKDTHRGISDLHESLFPATLYSAMYITNCIATMTRGQDKRVYYVKQNVDTNISKTLLTTISQIKKGNMNIRQIENVNHILNISGRFNDYIIPKNSSGESPIDFEVMQGQNVELKTEIMNILEEMAVNPTDVPLELIQLRQSVEYATQFTMSSSKFLRKVYNRQSKCNRIFTRIFNKLYQNEYNDITIDLSVTLPPPMFLNITNTNQMITNVVDFSNSIADIELADEEDETIKKLAVKEIVLHYLGSYIDIPQIEETIKRAKQATSAKIVSTPAESNE